MRRSRQEPFTTIKTVGGLLPAEILQRIVEGDRELDGLTPESYHLNKNERLNEAINRSWNRCVGAWWVFTAGVKSLPESDAGTTLTRERWLHILFNELGYGRLPAAKAREIDGKTYPISHSWQHTPIHFVTFRQDLDQRTPGVAGAAKMSPHSLVQEFLNRSQNHLWGFVSNGYGLRILRDNVSLTRQAYVEFDIEGMMEGEVYSDFVLLFMLLHQSRVEAEKPEQCWLERWSQEAQQRGTRALDQLREGVEKAIATLGQGFIAHPSNTSLRDKLQSGELSTLAYYQQLLRLVYRMIFLFVAEDRDLLLLPDAPHKNRRQYLDHYSITRIRRIAGRLRGTRHGDLWQALLASFQCAVNGEEGMGLAPLGGFLFSDESLADLNDSQLANDALLETIRYLSFTKENKLLRPVDYRNLGTEELGSVYESLLELHPEVNVSAYTFELKVAVGSERKTTGSYYTPASLIKCLLDSALEPVIQRALKKPDPEKAILELKVVDPASGSGHFLIAAAHRIAKHLAMVRTGESEPAPEERRRALRDVVRRCIYGVDVNPLAVELCKVALWIETLDPGRPLGFLDHQIKCGNSLIGASPELLEMGIPDDAFKPLEGDDKEVAKEVRKRNKQERLGQQDLYAPVEEIPNWQKAVRQLQHVVGLPENAVHEVREKAALYETVCDDKTYLYQHRVADLWTAAFFWPLTKETASGVPTEDVYRRFQRGSHSLKDDVLEQVDELASEHCFFHWHLEFPEVFMDDRDRGFDCVIGNPPWEKLQTEELQFFAVRDPEIANLKGAKRKAAIRSLWETNPILAKAWFEQRRFDSTAIGFIRNSGNYPLTGVGKFNTFALFAELKTRLLSANGRLGTIVPSGIATDDTTKLFFSNLMKFHSLVSLYDFENREGIFHGVHRAYRFCLLTAGGASHLSKMGTEFAFFLQNLEQLRDDKRRFILTADDLALINPNTLNCPIFRYKRDVEITKGIYSRIPIFLSEKDPNTNAYKPKVWRLLNTTDDSSRFISTVDAFNSDKLVPVVEAKTLHQFDHRFATFRHSTEDTKEIIEVSDIQKASPYYEVSARYYIDNLYFCERMPNELTQKTWFMTIRNITHATNERTAICSIIPRGASCEVTPYIEIDGGAKDSAFLAGVLNSFVLDYFARQKISGTHLSYFILYQLPIISPKMVSYPAFDFFTDRILELVYTSNSLRGFASEFGYDGAPFRWDVERRFFLRCELDAGFFHLYGTGSEDVDFIMETFPVVKRRDIQKYGDYRTKLVILKIYDDMQKAIETGQPYKTLLDPPPADPRIAHPSRGNGE